MKTQFWDCMMCGPSLINRTHVYPIVCPGHFEVVLGIQQGWKRLWRPPGFCLPSTHSTCQAASWPTPAGRASGWLRNIILSGMDIEQLVFQWTVITHSPLIYKYERVQLPSWHLTPDRQTSSQSGSQNTFVFKSVGLGDAFNCHNLIPFYLYSILKAHSSFRI